MGTGLRFVVLANIFTGFLWASDPTLPPPPHAGPIVGPRHAEMKAFYKATSAYSNALYKSKSEADLTTATSMDRAKYFPKLKAFADRIGVLFPETSQATRAAEAVLEREIEVTDPASFLEKVRLHDESNPDENDGARLLAQYAYLRLRQDPKEAIAYLEDGLKLYPGDFRLTDYQTALKRIGKAVRLQGPDLDGKSVDTDLWKGKVIVVNFWTSPLFGTGVVRQGMPESLIKAYPGLKAKGVEFLGVTLTNDAEKEKIEFLLKHDVDWPQLALPDLGDIWDLDKEWGISDYAVLFVIGKNGELVSVEADAGVPDTDLFTIEKDGKITRAKADQGVSSTLKAVEEELKK